VVDAKLAWKQSCQIYVYFGMTKAWNAPWVTSRKSQ